jgi:hypothetical protein
MVMSGHMMALRRFALDVLFTAVRWNDIAARSFMERCASLHPFGRTLPQRPLVVSSSDRSFSAKA